MLDPPYTLLSCALSIDGYLGSAAPRRLELSNHADFDRVDAVRASCDAILVGAATVRNDNPRLLVLANIMNEPRVTLDGKWVLYVSTPHPAEGVGPQDLMRIPLSGGEPQFVSTVRFRARSLRTGSSRSCDSTPRTWGIMSTSDSEMGSPSP